MCYRFKTQSTRSSGRIPNRTIYETRRFERTLSVKTSRHHEPPPLPPPNYNFNSSLLLLGTLGTAAAFFWNDDNDKEKNKKIIEKFPGTFVEFPKEYSFPKQKLKVLPPDSKNIPVVLVVCGSFSPVTTMHLRLLEMSKDYFDSSGYEVIGGYISPVGDAYQKKGLVNAIDRTNMAILAVQESDWIMVDTWEAAKPKWTRTREVLDHFSQEVNGLKKYDQNVQVIFVCGSDLLDSFNTPGLWADEDIQQLCDYGLAVVTREGSDPSGSIWKNDLLYLNRTKIHKIHQWIPNDISSTLVRLGISRGLSIQYLLPKAVVEYIREKGLYREEVEEDKYSK